MKILKFVAIALLISTSIYSTEIAPLPETNPDVKELSIPGIDHEALKKGEIEVKPESVKELFGQQSGYSLFGYTPGLSSMIPYAQELVYSDGELCHVGYYGDVTVVTTLSGYTYGYQVMLSPYGQVLSTQSFYYQDSNIYGDYLRHEYLDVTIVTGSEQVVYFK